MMGLPHYFLISMSNSMCFESDIAALKVHIQMRYEIFRVLLEAGSF